MERCSAEQGKAMKSDNKFELLARAGYAARGVVYFLLGGIALAGVFGAGGEGTTGTQGALSTLLDQPFGRVMLGAIAIGLIGHVLWRLAQSLLNADRQDGDGKGYAVRAAQLISAITHGALALFAGRLALGMGQSGGSGGEQDVASWLMQLPLGRILVAVAGLAVVAAGAVQIYRGVSGQYEKWLRLPADKAGWLKPISAYGLAARGVIFLILGGFFLYAAWTVDASQAGSFAQALDWVRSLPFGAILYALVALGLFAFGGYSVIEALYRHVDAPSGAEAARALGSRG
jgi:hypothetical protein